MPNTDVTGLKLYGVESLLQRLEGLTKQKKLEQYAFTGPDMAGSLLLEGSKPTSFVGAVLFDFPAKAAKKADLG